MGETNENGENYSCKKVIDCEQDYYYKINKLKENIKNKEPVLNG